MFFYEFIHTFEPDSFNPPGLIFLLCPNNDNSACAIAHSAEALCKIDWVKPLFFSELKHYWDQRVSVENFTIFNKHLRAANTLRILIHNMAIAKLIEESLKIGRVEEIYFCYLYWICSILFVISWLLIFL